MRFWNPFREKFEGKRFFGYSIVGMRFRHGRRLICLFNRTEAELWLTDTKPL